MNKFLKDYSTYIIPAAVGLLAAGSVAAYYMMNNKKGIKEMVSGGQRSNSGNRSKSRKKR